MRITRLQLLIIAIGLVCLLFGISTYLKQRSDQKALDALEEARRLQDAQTHRMAANRNVNQQEKSAVDHLAQNARQSIAVVGEAYRPMIKQYGDIPPIATPLRAAKTFLEQNHYEEAVASARESWQALKDFRAKAATAPGMYVVARGDTLWHIARAHSPVRQGPGWVAIWHANEGAVPNFNRIEVGTSLTIPQERSQYIMPYWKPRGIH